MSYLVSTRFHGGFARLVTRPLNLGLREYLIESYWASLKVYHPVPAPPAAGAAPVFEAVRPKRPTPPVEVRIGSDNVPSCCDILNDTMLDPAGLLSRK